MKIYIKEGKKIIIFLFPNFLMKTALLDKMLYDDDKPLPSKNVRKENRIEFYKGMKNYIKRNGHFNLVEANTSDGEKVIIKI